MPGTQDVLRQRNKSGHTLVNTVLNMGICLQRWSTVVTEVLIVWNHMGRDVMISVDLARDQGLHNNKDEVADGNSSCTGKDHPN